RVRVLLERPDERLRPGMSARARIQVTTHPGATVVPIQAVVERRPESPAGEADGATAADDEIPVVFVVADGRAQQRPVTTGISDPTHVEIVDGLAAGDVVVNGPYRALKDLKAGDRVRVSRATAGGGGEDDED